jgi:hypothetical protein
VRRVLRRMLFRRELIRFIDHSLPMRRSELD